MSSLSVYHVSSPDLPNKVLTHFEDIAATLAEQGIAIERWPHATRIEPGASQEQVLGAFQAQLDPLMSQRGHASLEVLSRKGSYADIDGSLPEEQRLDDDAALLLLAGRGLLYLHIDDYVYGLVCERHELVSLPAGTAHWFDMGEQPDLVAIRLFGGKTATQAAKITGDAIASVFPRLDD
ncbi:acireductone dioxygenase [Pseudomonas piscis]|uniref:Acireductone dioxygenase n=1 Tax=Pseudomonas piscis TaxID=2614538 RepID=A0A7X1U6A0_9PSED|nr:acireductone dioxygenase [Pseudomonas piscis]MQA55786.1 acireductone dioxygenase [Pseudomonas piscis]